MKANPDKCLLLVKNNTLTSVNINGSQITNSTKEKLLGIKLHSTLSFENHVSSLCKNASPQLHALIKIVNYMNLSKRKALTKTFAIFQFNYYNLVWMLHSRKLNNCINSIHERALRVTYEDYKSMFLQLLQKENTVTIHQQNLRALATEIFKVKKYL